MNSFWSKAYGCQADDCYELLKTFLRAQGDILGVEAARFFGCGLEVIEPWLQRLVEEGLVVAEGQGSTRFYRWQEAAPLAE